MFFLAQDENEEGSKDDGHSSYASSLSNGCGNDGSESSSSHSEPNNGDSDSESESGIDDDDPPELYHPHYRRGGESDSESESENDSNFCDDERNGSQMPFFAIIYDSESDDSIIYDSGSDDSISGDSSIDSNSSGNKCSVEEEDESHDERNDEGCSSGEENSSIHVWIWGGSEDDEGGNGRCETYNETADCGTEEDESSKVEDYLKNLTVKVLQQRLKEKGMPIYGLKSDLIARLLGKEDSTTAGGKTRATHVHRLSIVTHFDIRFFGLTVGGFEKERQNVRSSLLDERFRSIFGPDPRSIKDLFNDLGDEFDDVIYWEVMMALNFLKLCKLQ